MIRKKSGFQMSYRRRLFVIACSVGALLSMQACMKPELSYEVVRSRNALESSTAASKEIEEQIEEMKRNNDEIEQVVAEMNKLNSHTQQCRESCSRGA